MAKVFDWNISYTLICLCQQARVWSTGAAGGTSSSYNKSYIINLTLNIL